MDKELIKFEDIENDAQIKVTKTQLINIMTQANVEGVTNFVNNCANMAANNWCPAHVEMLERLFYAVLTGKPYAEQPEEEQ